MNRNIRVVNGDEFFNNVEKLIFGMFVSFGVWILLTQPLSLWFIAFFIIYVLIIGIELVTTFDD